MPAGRPLKVSVIKLFVDNVARHQGLGEDFKARMYYVAGDEVRVAKGSIDKRGIFT